MTIAANQEVSPRAVSAATWKNRAGHYWALIKAASGRRKERAARDYVAAMLADQPPELIEAVVRAVEKLLGCTEGGK